jgi:hypothetical protein
MCCSPTFAAVRTHCRQIPGLRNVRAIEEQGFPVGLFAPFEVLIEPEQHTIEALYDGHTSASSLGCLDCSPLFRHPVCHFATERTPPHNPHEELPAGAILIDSLFWYG